jgi:hypothetical protein
MLIWQPLTANVGEIAEEVHEFSVRKSFSWSCSWLEKSQEREFALQPKERLKFALIFRSEKRDFLCRYER